MLMLLSNSQLKLTLILHQRFSFNAKCLLLIAVESVLQGPMGITTHSNPSLQHGRDRSAVSFALAGKLTQPTVTVDTIVLSFGTSFPPAWSFFCGQSASSVGAGG